MRVYSLGIHVQKESEKKEIKIQVKPKCQFVIRCTYITKVISLRSRNDQQGQVLESTHHRHTHIKRRTRKWNRMPQTRTSQCRESKEKPLLPNKSKSLREGRIYETNKPNPSPNTTIYEMMKSHNLVFWIYVNMQVMLSIPKDQPNNRSEHISPVKILSRNNFSKIAY